MNNMEERIEEMRKEMYEVYTTNPTDPRLLSISQELDVLLNKLRNEESELN